MRCEAQVERSGAWAPADQPSISPARIASHSCTVFTASTSVYVVPTGQAAAAAPRRSGSRSQRDPVRPLRSQAGPECGRTSDDCHSRFLDHVCLAFGGSSAAAIRATIAAASDAAAALNTRDRDLRASRSSTVRAISCRRAQMTSPCVIPWWSNGIAEIGVVTPVRHRRQGHGALTCEHLARSCEALGFLTSWTCDEDNAGSVATARRLGFKTERPYELLTYKEQSD
jgi:hypothetical protein